MQTGVIVVGGGQAGLALGYHLAQQGRDFVILDAGARIGEAWRRRWDSLQLFTPARYSALPGMPFPDNPDAYPGKEAVAAYLESYAERFSLPVRLAERVSALRATPGGYAVETGSGRYEAEQVVVATGPFQRLWVPPVAGALSREVVQLHSAEYRNPSLLPAGEVLVVGAGNSGVQIAEELARTRRVTLAAGERMPRLPERFLGRSLFWWLEKVGLLKVTVDSRLGRRMSRTDSLIGTSLPMLRARGVQLADRVVAAEGATVTTSDGRKIQPAAVVWATGYRADFGWIEPPVLDARGLPVQRRGVTSAPGLYFLGLPWMHTRGSALIGWVGRDAAYLASRIATHAASPPTPSEVP